MLAGTGNKKMLNMLILEILKDYSDAEHPLTQQDIMRYLRDNYNMECDRRSVRNNIEYLMALGFDIETAHGYYLAERKFDPVELQLLINSVVFSKSLSKQQAAELIEKLRSEANVYFEPRLTHVSNFTDLQRTDNRQSMLNLDILDEAIAKKRKVSFVYNSYGTDFKMHPRREEPFVFNPYQIVISNGRYYLVGNYDKYDTISHFRIDRMTNMKMLEEPSKDPKLVKGMEHGLNLPKHMAEHIYMFSGETVTVVLKAPVKSMDDLMDWFGRDFHITKKNPDGTIEITLRCNKYAMEYWALQYGKTVEILEPPSLREQVKEDIRGMAVKYGILMDSAMEMQHG